MMSNKRAVGPWMVSILTTLFLKMTSFCKASFILGSSGAFFSLAPVMVPLSGLFGGLHGSMLMFALSVFVRCFWSGSFSLHFLAYHIPGLFASLYWACPHWGFRLLPSVLCAILFLVHPVGYNASLYAALWLIPVAIYFFSKKNIFLNALASTFTAHAVGSVIWLYTMPMSPENWLMLIPVALIERVLFAGGMVMVYYGFIIIHAAVKKGVFLSTYKSA